MKIKFLTLLLYTGFSIMPAIFGFDDISFFLVSIFDSCRPVFSGKSFLIGAMCFIFSAIALKNIINMLLPSNQLIKTPVDYKFLIFVPLSLIFLIKYLPESEKPKDPLFYLQESAEKFAHKKKQPEYNVIRYGVLSQPEKMILENDGPVDIKSDSKYSCHVIIAHDSKNARYFSTFKIGKDMLRDSKGNLVFGFYEKTN